MAVGEVVVHEVHIGLDVGVDIVARVVETSRVRIQHQGINGRTAVIIVAFLLLCHGIRDGAGEQHNENEIMP
ncbi:MAG: hypothetical protein ACYSSN_05595 [Planctomycetota bacterium]